uniref:BRO1 domain-containing protein n=1 Tax=Phytophthora ramorum TaxID=164328 RepID=H3GP96_PHYRM
MTQREALPPCCHALSPGRKVSSQPKFASELTKFGVSTKRDGVQRLASDLSAARAALQLEGIPVTSVFQSADDISSYSQKLVAYLALVKGFTESAAAGPNDAVLQASVAATDATADTSLRQPLVEAADAQHEATDCSGCLNFCRWQDALTGQTVYARSARQETAHVLLAAGTLMMMEARDKVDAILTERLSELSETQLKVAYQLLLHAAGVLEACLESMNVAPRAIGAEFADLGAKTATEGDAQVVADESGPAPDDDTMAKWREEQRQAEQAALSKAAPDTITMTKGNTAKPAVSGAVEDLAMLKRVPDLADGRFPQLLAWIALAEAQELVVLRGVTQCQTIAARLLPYSTSTTAERIRLYCAYKEPYYQATSTYFQGAACMVKEDARNCVQAVANLKKAAALFEGVVPLEKSYEAKMATDKDEKARVALLAAVFLRSQQIISRDLDIVSHRNDSVYYEPVN